MRTMDEHGAGIAQRAVLIGTAGTVSLLERQLALVAGAPDVAGCVLFGGEGGAEGTLPRVLGRLSELERVVEREGVGLALVSFPRGCGEVASRVLGELARVGVEARFVPPLDEVVLGAVSAERGQVEGGRGEAMGAGGRSSGVAAGAVDASALLGRVPHAIDRASVGRLLAGRRVLITGAGGSIGSELCRVVASFDPELLILMERSENALFEIDRAIASRFPGVARRSLLHDVVDEVATHRLVRETRPDVVFHAAAHKHVPLMEDHPAHAVTNNLFGTRSIADASLAAGVERFVMISSDKAVNPVSVMGATKRLAELYVQGLHRRVRETGEGGTRFCMVRFGNVLGSAGSVVPIWAAQLADGGPLTVTDPRMTRYFMTIREAATLVVQAGAVEGGDLASAPVYVLDMGEPVRIVDLACRFIRAHGYETRLVESDAGVAGSVMVRRIGGGGREWGRPVIDVVFTGARPGEKLFEELAYAAEQLSATSHPGINAWVGADEGAVPDRVGLAAMVEDLASVQADAGRDVVLAAIRRHLPEMVRPVAMRKVG